MGLSSELCAAVFVLTVRERERESPLVPIERQTGWILWPVWMDPEVSPNGPFGQSGWTLWSVWMDPVVSQNGPCSPSGWTLWSVQMDPVVSPNGPYSPSGWTLWSVWMDPVVNSNGPCSQSGCRSEVKLSSLCRHITPNPVLRPAPWLLHLLSYAGCQFYL